MKDSSILHSVPYQIDYESEVPFVSKTYVRPKDCLVLISNQEDICSVCATMNSKHKKNMARKQKHINTPARLNAPLSRTDPNRVALALQEERKRNKKLMERIENELATKSVAVDKDIEADINFIMENTDSGKISDFMQLFWKQQKEAATKKKMMYHPMIIRFCLSLASKSSSAYDELRSVLTLPSRRTLNDYKNVIKPSAGFNPDVIAELTKLAAPLREYQRYICLSFDEMKIKENLVFDKHTEKLVGFVDLGDPDVNFSNFPENVLASHALVFYVRGIASDLKFALAYFATCGINAHQIMSLFWDAVSYLELSCTLPVVACVSDGASANRKFYKMHATADDDNDGIPHKTLNPFCNERYIYFFADAPHLMKTLRNCMYHSGYGDRATRLMWNDGKEILWSHVFRLAQDELDRDIKLAPKLTMEHVNLSPFSKMNVKLATQVLSQTTANILFSYYPKETHGSAEYCQQMNKFFDTLNVRNQSEHVKQRKCNVAPFREENDDRLDWLTNDFLNYLNTWKESVSNREGNFSAQDRKKMFLSQQTYEGLVITAKSTVGLARYLLSTGMKFVLTEKFNQDVVEEYFMRQRSLGRRNDNPDMYQFGYQSNTIRIQRSIVPMTGNTRGKYTKRVAAWQEVDNTPLNKRQKQSAYLFSFQ